MINGVTYTGVTCSVATPCQTAGVDPNFLSAYTAVWNVDIQRAITNNVTVDVAYVGNHGFNEETIVDRNQPKLGAGWDASAVGNCLGSMPLYNKCTPDATAEVGQYTNIFPYLSQIDIATNGDFSNYNALQATLQARNYHGLGLIAGYTFAHALSIADTNSTDSSNLLPTDKNNLRLGYGNSNYDIRQRFTLSPNYRIPGMKSPGQMLEGWSINAIITLQTGLPWTAADLTTVDWLEPAKQNSSIGAGSYQFWNYSGSPSAFTGSNSDSVLRRPCRLHPLRFRRQRSGACTAAGSLRRRRTTQTVALAALANSACYIQNGGVLTPPAFGTLGDAGHGSSRTKLRQRGLLVTSCGSLRNDTCAVPCGILQSLQSGRLCAVTLPVPIHLQGLWVRYLHATPDSTNPVLGSGGPRHIQFGLKLTY